jgi:PAS domain S-box-containing protein
VLSIRQVLVGQFLLVVLVAGVVVALLMYFWRLPMVQAQSEAEQHRAAAVATHHVEVNLQYAEELALALASSLDLVAFDKGVGKQAFDTLITRLARETGFFQAIYVLDEAHRIRDLVATNHMSERLIDWRGNDLSGLEVLQRVYATRTAAWSDHYQSPVLNTPVVSFVAPTATGYLMVELAVERLSEAVLRSSALDGLLVVVVDGKGEVVAAPDMGWAYARYNIGHWPLVSAAMAGQPEHGEVVFKDQSYLGTAQRLSRVGWVVLAGYPTALVHGATVAALSISVVTMVLAVGVGLVLLWWFANLVQRRLDRSVAFAEAVSHGHHLTPLPDVGVIELRALGQSLNQMARNIQQRETQLRAVVDITPTMAIQFFDRDGHVVDWNPASERVLGWTRDEAMGKTLDQLIYTPEQQTAFIEVLRGIEQTGQPFGPYEGGILRRLSVPAVILSTTFAIPDLEGGQVFVCMDVDITDIKRQEQAVRESEEKFNLLFQASPVAVAVLVPDGDTYRYVNVNDAWVNLLGYGHEDVVGQDLNMGGTLLVEGNLARMYDDLARQGSVSAREGRLFCKSGTKIRIEAYVRLVRLQEQTLMICSLIDITEKRRMERALRQLNAELEDRIERRTQNLSEANDALTKAFDDLRKTQTQLVQSEKLASLGSLVAGVAHELNTPVGNALMAVSTLDQRLKDFYTRLEVGLRKSDLDTFVQQVSTATDISSRNLHRASELVSGFKQVAVDQTSSQRRVFHLDELVREILLTLQPTFLMQVDVPTGIQMDSYPGPLGQVLTNLIQNAVVHAFDGRRHGAIWLAAQVQSDGMVTLRVEDDGLGIPADKLDKVFDPFFTTRLGKGGSGLGLHIAHNIVTGLLGGQVVVHNRQEGGAAFVVTCPVSSPVTEA